MDRIPIPETKARAGQDATDESYWRRLYDLVRRRYPYSQMSDVRVEGGKPASYGAIRYTVGFGDRAGSTPGSQSARTDRQWDRFIRFCEELERGILTEVHFMEGRPVFVAVEEEGETLIPAGPACPSTKGGDD